jgi:hypothetical protein
MSVLYEEECIIFAPISIVLELLEPYVTEMITQSVISTIALGHIAASMRKRVISKWIRKVYCPLTKIIYLKC